MSKLLSSVLDKISENNNEYRTELRSLNNKIDEKTTTLIGDVVTLSGYMVDFSNAINLAKDSLVNPIARIVEQYVIKDLRSVETVNEQFIEKINDKLENENVNTKEEKEKFNKNLSSLLNDKYLEIVKIKRVPFTDESGSNEEIENTVNGFISNLVSNVNVDNDRLNNIVNGYKAEIYALISSSLTKISTLYLNNFVNEVSSALEVTDGIDDEVNENLNQDTNDFKPFIPEINPVPQNDIPFANTEDLDSKQEENKGIDIPVIPDIPPIPSIPEIEPEVNKEEIKPMDVNLPTLEEVKEPQTEEKPKKTYDVEEILKIAKSPIVATPEETPKKDDSYVSVEPIEVKDEKNNLDAEFDAREIVEEMINRFTKRLDQIDQRKAKYEEETNKLKEDEAFVNDLIKSSKQKKEELDAFEKELDEKEKELDEKQKELDKKINDIMPFANAVLKSEES